MRAPTLSLLAVVLGSIVLAACASSTSEDAAQGSEAEVTALSLKCTYGNAELDVAGGTGTLKIGAQSIGYACAAPATPTSGEVLACAEQPTTLHAGVWSFAVEQSGSTYSAVLTRPGTADIAFACSADGTTADAGPPATDASVSMDGGAAPDAPVTWAEAGPIIHATCDGCHHNGFQTLAAVKAHKSDMIRLISAGKMPKNNPTWNATAAGKEVLSFLQNSPELQ